MPWVLKGSENFWKDRRLDVIVLGGGWLCFGSCFTRLRLRCRKCISYRDMIAAYCGINNDDRALVNICRSSKTIILTVLAPSVILQPIAPCQSKTPHSSPRIAPLIPLISKPHLGQKHKPQLLRRKPPPPLPLITVTSSKQQSAGLMIM
jgi:hypothetical protein